MRCTCALLAQAETVEVMAVMWEQQQSSHCEPNEDVRGVLWRVTCKHVSPNSNRGHFVQPFNTKGFVLHHLLKCCLVFQNFFFSSFKDDEVFN